MDIDADSDQSVLEQIKSKTAILKAQIAAQGSIDSYGFLIDDMLLSCRFDTFPCSAADFRLRSYTCTTTAYATRSTSTPVAKHPSLIKLFVDNDTTKSPNNSKKKIISTSKLLNEICYVQKDNKASVVFCEKEI